MYLFILLFCIISSRAYHRPLHTNEWLSIRRILQNKETPLQIRQKINHILYKKYENYAERIAYKFKKLHTYKCRYIISSDLYLSAKIGLYKAIKNYNSTYSFHPYVNIYIQGELYKCLTNYLPIQFKSNSSYVMKTNYIARIKNKEVIYKISNKINTNKYIDYETLYYPSSIPKYFNNLYWEQITDFPLTSFQRRILYIKYKYFIYGKKINNKKLAQYMGCSEEKVRYNLQVCKTNKTNITK